MQKPILCVSVLSVVLCLCPRLCSAQTVFTRDTIIDRQYDAVIARENHNTATSPTITVVKGGRVDNSLQAWNESVVNVTDGFVNYLFGQHHSRLLVSGGEIGIGGVEAIGNARATVSGGTLGGGVTARDNAIVTVKGGYVPSVRALGFGALANISSSIGGLQVGALNRNEVGGQAVVTGGSIGGQAIVFPYAELLSSNAFFEKGIDVQGFLTFDSGYARDIGTNGGTTTINGGTVEIEIAGGGKAVIVINDVTCKGFLDLRNTSIADLNGGSIDQVTLANLSTLDMYGGNIAHDVVVLDKAEFNRYGGTVGGKVQDISGTYINDDGTLSLFGYDLSSSLIDPNYNNQFSLYRLSGFLSDNTNLSGELLFVENGGGARFEFVPQGGPGPSNGTVPEPGTVTLLFGAGTAYAGLVIKRRMINYCRLKSSNGDGAEL